MVFIPLFVAIDVFFLIAYFSPITSKIEKAKSRKLARQAVLTALVVGLAFMAIGEFVFSVLGITVNDFKVAGGALLFVIAIKELADSSKASTIADAGQKGAAVPLGVPLIVGPAVLTTLLVLTEHYGAVPTISSFVLNLVLVWIALESAHRIIRVIKEEYIMVISKIMAILLASIAVMMMRIGLTAILG